MSGARLGRGRGGRFAIYVGCGAVIVLLVFAYRAAVAEMARLRELHEQCAHQHEALAAQLQVIFEYKVRLEKSLAEEKSSNAAVKQELQQRATREKTLRDKDGIEALNRYNSLQQEKKKLETEHQDLVDECDKRQKQALEEHGRLEETLQKLRSELRQARDDGEKSLEQLKTKYLEVEIEKTKVEEKYNEILRNNGDADVRADHLQKRVIELTRELDGIKKTHHEPPKVEVKFDNEEAPRPDEAIRHEAAGAAGSQDNMNLARPPHRQQSSSTTKVSKVQTPKTIVSSVKPSIKTITQPSQKLAVEGTKAKLPEGVVAIPKLFEIDEKAASNNVKDEGLGNHVVEETIGDKDKAAIGAEDNLDARQSQGGRRRGGDQGAGRQDSWAWQHRVQPGAQEVGDETNNMERIPGPDDGGVQQGGDGMEYQYDGGDYDKEPGKLKNNDLRIEEGEGEDEGEGEGEDEDDAIDYEGNHVKADKRP